MTAPLYVVLDLAGDETEAVGLLNDLLVALRSYVMQADAAAIATVAAPEGWHRVVVTAMPGGHTVLGVRYAGLSKSRTNNVAEALDRRGWQLDEDGGGATHRHPPGTDALTVAFEMLTVARVAGAPRTPRRITAVDPEGSPVAVGLEERLVIDDD
jgi:hypothetical protein